jgi:hypothetical protein
MMTSRIWAQEATPFTACSPRSSRAAAASSLLSPVPMNFIEKLCPVSRSWHLQLMQSLS